MPNDILSLIAEVDAESTPAPLPVAKRSPLDLIAEVEAEDTNVSRPMTDDERVTFDAAASDDAVRDLQQQHGGVGGKILSLPVVRELRGGLSAGVKGIGQSYAQLADWLGVPGAGDVANDLGNERERARADVATLSQNSMASRVGTGLVELAPQVAEMALGGGVVRKAVTAIPGASKFMAQQVAPRVLTAGMAAHDAATNAEHTARAEGMEGDERRNYVLRAGLIEGGITALGGLAGVESLAAGRQGMTQLRDGFMSWVRQNVPAAAKAAGGEAIEENAVNLFATFNDFASLPSNRGRPMGEVWAQWAQQIPETTLIAGIAGGGSRLMSQAPREGAPYEVTAEERAAIDAMAPDDGQVVQDPRTRAFTQPAQPDLPPVSVTQERIDLERQRPDIESVDPRMQRLMDEEEEGAVLPRQQDAQEQAAIDDERQRVQQEAETVERRARDDRQFREETLAMVNRQRPADDQMAREHMGLPPEPVEEPPAPFTIGRPKESTTRPPALPQPSQVDLARQSSRQRAEALSIEENEAAGIEEGKAADVAGRTRPTGTSMPMGPTALETGDQQTMPGRMANISGERPSVPPVRSANAPMSRTPSTGANDPLSTSQPRPGAAPTARPSEASRPTAVRVRSIADLDRGFREVYGLKPQESAAAIALVRARAAALGEDPDTYAARTISEVRQGLPKQGETLMQGDEAAKSESALDRALRSVGLSPEAGTNKAADLRRKADGLTKRAMDAMSGIPAGQPIHSTRDRSKREQSAEMMRRAGDLYRQAEEIEQGNNPLYQGPPADPEIESRIAATFANFDAAREAYAKLPESEGGKVLNVDIARELSQDYAASKESRNRLSVATHEPASAFIKKLYIYQLKNAKPGSVMFLAGGGGSGKSTVKDGPARADRDRAAIIMDAVLGNFDKASRQIDEALRHERPVSVNYVHAPFAAAVERALSRGARIGRTVPLEVLAEAHAGAQDTAIRLVERFAGNEKVQVNAYDNTGKTAVPMSIAQLVAIRYTPADGTVKDTAAALAEGLSQATRDRFGAPGTGGRGATTTTGDTGPSDTGGAGRVRPPPGTTLHQDLKDAPRGVAEKGAISFIADGRAVLHALTKPNASTAFHELFHSFRRGLTGRDAEYAARWSGARKKADGSWQWTRSAEEKWARAGERYLRDGTAPTPVLRKIFDQMREWMRSIYQAIKGSEIDVDLNPEIRAVFDRLFTPKDAVNADRLAKGVAADGQRAANVREVSGDQGSTPDTSRTLPREQNAPNRERSPAIDERDLPAREQVEDNSPAAEKSSTPRTVEPPKPTRETPLAIPSKDEGERKTIADLDKKRDEPERRDQDNIHEQAARAVTNDYAGERKRILALTTNGEVLSDLDTAMAQELLRRDTQQAMATGSAADLKALAAMHAAYRDSGTEQARALAIRRDPAETPNRRRLRMVTDSILTPPKPLRDAMQKARERLRKAIEGGHIEDAAAARRKLFLLTDRAEKRLERVRSFFKKEGIDLLYQGENAQYIASMVNASSKANGTFNGALREYWINSVLSGPRSLVVNAAAVNAMWKLGIDRFAEAALNSARGGKNMDAATLTEYRIMWKGLLPGLSRGLQNAARSFMSERPIFGEDLQGNTQFDDYGPQIKGTLGRIVRLPSRLLLAADQFNKTWSANVEVMAQAYRLSRKQLGADASEEALTKRTQELVEDLESPAWDKAKEAATEWAFQEDVPDAIQGVYKVRDAKLVGTDFRPFFYILPFIKTPTNIIRQGVTASPLGMARLLWKLGNDYAGTGTYEQSALARDAAQQMVSWGVSLGLMALAGMEDEEGRPYLTGSEGAYNKGKAGLQQETMKPYTLRVPGTAIELDYQRVEPFATWFGMVADGTRIAKRSAKGENVSDTITKLKDAVAAQVLDKSMLKSLSDIYQAFAPGVQSEGRFTKWSKDFATSWIPNVVRAPLRDQDNTVRESGVWGEGADFWRMYFKRGAQSVAPWTQRPRINLLGDEVTKADAGPMSDIIARMTRVVSPSVVTGTRTPPDLYRWLTNWNNDPKKAAYFPSAMGKSYKIGDESRYFTEEQYEKAQREAGRLLKQALVDLAKDGNAINPEKPTDVDRKVVEKLISRTRRAARNLVLNSETGNEEDDTE